MKIQTNLPGPTLARLRRQYRLNYFVETGAGHGNTTELAALYFDKVFTCEIDESLTAEVIERMAPYLHVQVHCLPSPEFLRKIKSQLDQPTLYWLDAHWCGGPVKPERECPLLDGLAAIGGLHGHSVILADDAGYFISPPPPPHDPKQWPTMDQINDVLASWKEDLVTEVIQGPNSKVLIVRPSLGERTYV